MSNWDQNSETLATFLKECQAIQNNYKFILIDGGAAGKISEPFDVAAKLLQIVRFEPRGEKEVSKSDNCIYVDGGLWENDGYQVLHIANNPTTSSICPPDLNFLAQFDPKYGVPTRRTVEERRVKVRSIDSCVANGEFGLPNFIKLDVHSSELPALEGAKNSLENCVGILVETWNVGVHKNQGLHWQVEKFVMDHGFEIYDCYDGAKWRVLHEGNLCLADKRRYIGSDALYIKREIPKHLIYNKILILVLFGFYNEAKNLIKESNSSDLNGLYNGICDAQMAILKIMESELIKLQNSGIR